VKDFDVERRRRIAAPRQFKIQGETFTRVAGCRPETMLAWSELVGEDGAPADGPHAIALIDRLFHDLIVPEDRDRWARVRADDSDAALTIEDLRDVLQWIVAGVLGRPLEGPSSFSDSSVETTSATGSTGDSSSPASPKG
jgi:hypothetical protein